MLEDLASLDFREEWDNVYSKLIQIVEILLCRSTHGRKAIEELLALNNRMIEWLYKGDEKRANISVDSTLTLIETWVQELCRNSDTTVAKLRDHLEQRAKSESGEVDQAEAPKARDEGEALAYDPLKLSLRSTLNSPLDEADRIQYIHHFSRYQPKNVSLLSARSATTRLIRTPLTNTELVSEYVYIYWCPGNFGYVKIGVTDDVSQRLKGWEEQCKQEVREHFQQDSSERVLVKHAFRVEKIVHTALKEIRYQEIGCKGCGRRHIEWFRTSPEHAALVIKKYSPWAATNPYPFDKSDNGWRLDKKIGEREVEELTELIGSHESKHISKFRRRTIPRRVTTGKQGPGELYARWKYSFFYPLAQG
ncbi:DUF1766-domain-containing protein [Cucurbitaria berberidis CBS 394.84]|uniref:DUF1766-domain-containing protein n=1 Tax=Cucurbitaria berberidis CBS 394.84 TaxID=1168544 RepID=A0A9P4L8I8_9PLEO|nr:DUF1766-domain-containing protein [Cucurbitaria berberidis CBS 394.84]KAF1845392.1 DUF1766-domain-containing protein [Cucurbitaria berberidis CBS 394.84]